MAEFVNTMLVETETFEIDLKEFHQYMKNLAKGDIEAIKYIAKKLKDNTSIRDLINQESDIKMFYMVYFSLNKLYASIPEMELNKGYADIVLLKAPNIEFDIPNFLIEFKFFKQSENVSKDKLNQTINQAKKQVSQYKKSSKYRIDKAIIAIFKGFDLLYCEWE